jgi:hypothetical protein
MGPSHELLRQAGEAGGRATCSVIAQPPEGWWGKCGRGTTACEPGLSGGGGAGEMVDTRTKIRTTGL